ncbi:hypothetical protein NDU88_000256 [Pleurodeles waltl]|uniref:Uncharacterized protein n=1 Tax=Pleurodeles waltl TaxID=8319 RepID=A0AAV7L9M4_PLEWA|nr:hypothetical protein NDU88_000256 [Pleurodeles waltl]
MWGRTAGLITGSDILRRDVGLYRRPDIRGSDILRRDVGPYRRPDIGALTSYAEMWSCTAGLISGIWHLTQRCGAVPQT